MRVYVGQTRGRRLIAELSEAGYGECVQRGEGSPRREPWFLDNGAFRDWKAGRPFDGDAYRATFDRLVGSSPPDFIVLPDIVAGGRASLEFSVSWYAETRELALATWGLVPPLYVAVQDGFSREDVEEAIAFGDGVFVGGSVEWKLSAAPGIVARAHAGGAWYADGEDLAPVPVHIGRVGSGKRLTWARLIGADSADSCLPLWSKAKREIATSAGFGDLGDAVLRFRSGYYLAETTVLESVARLFVRGGPYEVAVDLAREVSEFHPHILKVAHTEAPSPDGVSMGAVALLRQEVAR
jgi:hypothetical protein